MKKFQPHRDMLWERKEDSNSCSDNCRSSLLILHPNSTSDIMLLTAGIQPNSAPLIRTQSLSQSMDTRLHTSKYVFYCKTPKGKGKGKGKGKSLSHVRPFATPWTVAHQAPPSTGFSRQEYWSGLPFPPPGDLPNPGTEPRSLSLQADALTSEPPGKPCKAPSVVPKIKENGQLLFKSSELLDGFWQRVLKVFIKGEGCKQICSWTFF